MCDIKEPKIKHVYYNQFHDVSEQSISIAKLTNEHDTVLHYSISIGKSFNQHIKLEMSESEFEGFVDDLYKSIYGDKCIYCDEKSHESVSVCNQCWEYQMKLGEP